MRRRSCGGGTAAPSDAVCRLTDRAGLTLSGRSVRSPGTRGATALRVARQRPLADSGCPNDRSNFPGRPISQRQPADLADFAHDRPTPSAVNEAMQAVGDAAQGLILEEYPSDRMTQLPLQPSAPGRLAEHDVRQRDITTRAELATDAPQIAAPVDVEVVDAGEAPGVKHSEQMTLAAAGQTGHADDGRGRIGTPERPRTEDSGQCCGRNRRLRGERVPHAVPAARIAISREKVIIVTPLQALTAGYRIRRER